jgi:hypothetical protein
MDFKRRLKEELKEEAGISICMSIVCFFYFIKEIKEEIKRIIKRNKFN